MLSLPVMDSEGFADDQLVRSALRWVLDRAEVAAAGDEQGPRAEPVRPRGRRREPQLRPLPGARPRAARGGRHPAAPRAAGRPRGAGRGIGGQPRHTDARCCRPRWAGDGRPTTRIGAEVGRRPRPRRRPPRPTATTATGSPTGARGHGPGQLPAGVRAGGWPDPRPDGLEGPGAARGPEPPASPRSRDGRAPRSPRPASPAPSRQLARRQARAATCDRTVTGRR